MKRPNLLPREFDEFTQVGPNEWRKGQSMILSFDQGGVARLIILRSGKVIAAGGAENPHQLRCLLKLEENPDS